MKRSMGLAGVFCISAGAMISSGLFVLPGLAFARAGPAVFLSYLLAGCVALTTVLSLSELVTAMPRAGGDYFYVSRTFGNLFGTVSGLLSWLALSLKSAFAVIGIAELIFLVSGIDLRVSALLLAAVFTAVNLAGVREAVRFQVMLVTALIVILGSFFVSGLREVSLPRLDPMLPHGLNSLFSTAGFVFVSFGGVLTTASIAGEIRDPSRNVPLGLIGSTIAVTLLYSLVIFVVVGTVPADTLRTSLAPVAMAARSTGGTFLYVAVIIASLLAFVTTANGGILTASRYPIALARDGMLPAIFLRTRGSRGTPSVSVIATGALIAVSVIIDLDMLIKAASAVILLSNIFAHLSVIVMRESRIANYAPTFRAPFYPWLQVAGIAAFVFLLVDMGAGPVLISLGFVLAGIALYFARRAGSRSITPALVHLVERITDRRLELGDLSVELREIVADRDGIVRDEFDRAIEESGFLEVEGGTGLDELWDSVASELHRSMPCCGAPRLAAMLRDREAESSTALNDFVAVPHLITDEGPAFGVVMVRAREGIRFSAEHPSVKAVFALAGSKDNRNLHLRSVAAIAQVIQDPGFEQRWLSARDHRELRDLFLLTRRKRGRRV